MALNHRRPFSAQFFFEGFYDSGMIVSGIVNTIAGKKIQNPAPIRGLQDCSPAPRVANIHPKNVQQPQPLRIYVLAVLEILVIAEAGLCEIDQLCRGHNVNQSPI
ncbi:MAG TPA: hypothetical protein VGG15_07065 [Terriglobales bacterium]